MLQNKRFNGGPHALSRSRGFESEDETQSVRIGTKWASILCKRLKKSVYLFAEFQGKVFPNSRGCSYYRCAVGPDGKNRIV